MRNKNAKRPPATNIAITAGAPNPAATGSERIKQSDNVNVETTLGALTPTVPRIQINGRNTARITKYSPLVDTLTISVRFTSPPMESCSRRICPLALYTLPHIPSPPFLRKEAECPIPAHKLQRSQHPHLTYKEISFHSSLMAGRDD